MSNATIGPSGAGKINNIAEKRGKEFAEAGVTTSQIRQIYAEVKRAETQYRSQDETAQARATLLLLKPKLAYTASRHEEMDVVKEFFITLIDKYVEPDDGNLDLFFELMEAIIAYHRYYTELEGS